MLIWLGKQELHQVDKKRPEKAPPTSTRWTLPVLSTTERTRLHLVRSKNDPHYFNDVCLGRLPYWSHQIEMCRSVVDYRVTVVYSGNAIGKDYWVGGLVPRWLYPRKDSLCIVTGPSQTLLGSVTLKEMRRAIDGCRLPFRPRITGGIKASPAMVEMRPG